jgi:hypothetical protein
MCDVACYVKREMKKQVTFFEEGRASVRVLVVNKRKVYYSQFLQKTLTSAIISYSNKQTHCSQHDKYTAEQNAEQRYIVCMFAS